MKSAVLAPLERVLRDWLGSATLVFKVTREGLSTLHQDEDDSRYLYCHSDAREDATLPDDYLAEGYLRLPRQQAERRYADLIARLRTAGVEASLDFVEVDEDGGQIGEEVTLR